MVRRIAGSTIDWDRPLRIALDRSDPRPPDDEPDATLKKNYAERLSRQLAIAIADAVRGQLSIDVSPKPDGTGQESYAGAGAGRKKLDVRASDDLGVQLGISIKTLSFRDLAKKRVLKRYSKNVSRNDLELQGEATAIHSRQPYAVLVALMFVPWTACLDGNPARRGKKESSFASMVFSFRKRTGRKDGEDQRFQLFEAFYIGIYWLDGDDRGKIRFFDVAKPPPKNAVPADDQTLSMRDLASKVNELVEVRFVRDATYSDGTRRTAPALSDDDPTRAE